MPNQSQTAPTQAVDTIETAHGKLLAVTADWAVAKAAGQPDVITGLIRRILTDVLEWTPDELTDCRTPAAPFGCIRLTVEGASRVAIIIQTKALGLKDRNTDRPYRLDGPVLTAHETAEGIRQACIVCGLKNTELAVLTNGEEWIVFRGSRIGDGKDTLEGLAFLFPSLQAVQETFKLFYDLLSRQPVVEMRYRAHFQEAEGQPIRARAFSKVLREQHQLHPIQPTALAADLDRIMESFFMRLSGDMDQDMLLNCFVTTRESKVAEEKIARISEDLVGRIRNIDTASAATLSDMIHKVQVTHRNEFVLLVGTKGAGKSTFIERFFKLVLPPRVKEECVFVNVDLKACEGSESSVIEWLDDTLLQKTEGALFEDAQPTYEETQGMFFDEYCRWRSGSFKHLYETDKTQFKIEFGRHIEQRRETRPHEYIGRLLSSIVKSRKKAPCIVFDNADHFSIEFQQKVFQYARSIYETTVCMMIMPITDKTSWQLSRQGALQSFETTSLFLPTPEPKTVLEQRIKYLESKVSDKDEEKGRGYFLGYGIKLDLDHLKAFTHCLQHVFLETGNASMWVGHLANMDIRRSLVLTRDIMASPYIEVEELLKAYITRTAQVIPEYDIQRAIIRRNYNFYPVSNNPFVQNIFSLRTEIGTSPLLGLRILTALHDAQHTEEMGKESFVAVSQLYDYFQATTIERRVVALWLDAMLHTGLCWSYDPTVTDIDKVQKIEISPSGRQHLFWGRSDESYLGSMTEVTPIAYQPTFDKMRAVPWENKTLEWLEKTVLFLDYLIEEDREYVRMPDHAAYEGQYTITRSLDRVARRLHAELQNKRPRRQGYYQGRQSPCPASVRETSENGTFDSASLTTGAGV